MAVSNRKLIEKFCKENNIKIIKLEFIRMRDACYGDTWDASFWDLECKINEDKLNFYSDKGDTVKKGIEIMFKDILKAIDSWRE